FSLRPECLSSDIFSEMTFLLLPLWRGMSIPLNCAFCSKIFLVKPYLKMKANCCSRKCLCTFTKIVKEPLRLEKIKGKSSHNSEGYLMKCKFCCKNFPLSPSRIGKKFFCNRKCYANWGKKGKDQMKYKRVTIEGKRILE